MKKSELYSKLKKAGAKVNWKMSDEALQRIYDRLLIKFPERFPPDKDRDEPAPPDKDRDEPAPPDKDRDEPQPEPEPTPVPVEPGEPEPQPEPEPAPVPVEPGEPVNEFETLADKIKSAKSPEEKKRVRKPVVERTTKKQKKGQSEPESFRIEGYVLLLITDTVFPFALSALNNMLDKRIKIRADQLQLKEKEFNSLQPLADQAADYMSVNINPVAGFLLIASFMYGSNLINARMDLTTPKE